MRHVDKILEQLASGPRTQLNEQLASNIRALIGQPLPLLCEQLNTVGEDAVTFSQGSDFLIAALYELLISLEEHPEHWLNEVGE